MKIKPVLIAIIVIGYGLLTSGTAITSQSPRSAVFSFLSCFGGSDVDDCDDITMDASGYIYFRKKGATVYEFAAEQGKAPG